MSGLRRRGRRHERRLHDRPDIERSEDDRADSGRGVGADRHLDVARLERAAADVANLDAVSAGRDTRKLKEPGAGVARRRERRRLPHDLDASGPPDAFST